MDKCTLLDIFAPVVCVCYGHLKTVRLAVLRNISRELFLVMHEL